MIRHQVKVGMLVTCKRKVEAYYSGVSGNPVCVFEPGMVGVMATVNTPSVTREGVSFCAVDFVEYGRVWRCSLHYDNIVKAKNRRGVIQWIPRIR